MWKRWKGQKWWHLGRRSLMLMIYMRLWWMQTCLGEMNLLRRRPRLTEGKERVKMWQNCWGHCRLLERQMKCGLGGGSFGGNCGEISRFGKFGWSCKASKNLLDKTPVSAKPSQPLAPKEVPTVADLDAPKLYPSSHINTLGIRIFKCPVCESTFRNHGIADAHIHKEHTKMKYGPCTKCGFTSWNGDSFWAHSKKHKWITFWDFMNFVISLVALFLDIITCVISLLPLWVPHGCGYPVPWYNYFGVKLFK